MLISFYQPTSYSKVYQILIYLNPYYKGSPFGTVSVMAEWTKIRPLNFEKTIFYLLKDLCYLLPLKDGLLLIGFISFFLQLLFRNMRKYSYQSVMTEAGRRLQEKRNSLGKDIGCLKNMKQTKDMTLESIDRIVFTRNLVRNS